MLLFLLIIVCEGGLYWLCVGFFLSVDEVCVMVVRLCDEGGVEFSLIDKC